MPFDFPKNMRVHHTVMHKNDLHLAMSPVADPSALIDSVDVDAVADKIWFRKHRKANKRIRPVTPREMKVFGITAECKMLVVRGPDGSQIRAVMGAKGSTPPPDACGKSAEAGAAQD